MGNIQMVGKSDAEMFKGEKPLQTKLAPMFSLTDVATHAGYFGCLPRTCRLPTTA